MNVFFFIFSFLNFLFVNGSLICKLKLKCEGECSDIYKIDYQNLTSMEIHPNQEFSCSLLDKITFINKKTILSGVTSDIGFICSLIIKDSNNDIVTQYNSYDESDNIFSCEPDCTLSSTKFLNFDDETEQIRILEFSGSSQAQVTINIPFNINIQTSLSSFNPISSGSQQTFVFSSIVTPIIATDLTRLKIKITRIPNTNYIKLYKQNNNIDIINDDEIGLDEIIVFKPIETNFGLFELKYKVVTIKSEELTQENSIKFNVCHRNCQSCNLYTSINPNESMECNGCITDKSYNVEGIPLTECYTPLEKEDKFPNYYLDTSSSNKIYKVCDNSCKKCETNDKNCIACSDSYFFIEEESTINQKCFSFISYINDKGNYFLLNPPFGNTYKTCDSNCQTCILNANNCLTCSTNSHFEWNNINTCVTTPTSINIFFIESENTYLEIDKSCSLSSGQNNKKKCTDCATNYYKYKEEDFCYLEEEVIYKYGISNYLNKLETPYKFKSCVPGCLICLDSTICLKCSDNYYFVNDNEYIGKCINKINIDENYFLPLGSDTYEHCEINCICKYKNNYCISCSNGKVLIEDENTCISDNVKSGYFFKGGILKKCDESCVECLDEGPDNCKECIEPYYLIEIDGMKRCITQFEKKQNPQYKNYYLKDDGSPDIKYQLCEGGCETCKDGADGTQCIQCKSDFYFYENSINDKQCYQKDNFFVTHENYYFNELLKEFRKCHKSCESCKDGYIYNNCTKCAPDYEFIDNIIAGKCIKKTHFDSSLKNYYFENTNIQKRDGTTVSVKIYKKCPENCETCKSFEDNPLKCTKCNMDKGYYKQNNVQVFSDDEEICLNNSIKINRYFNGNGYSPSISQCLISTYETQTKQSCIQCHNKLGFYSLEHSPETCEQNLALVDHYISSDNIIKKCPYECASCSEGPTLNSTNCDVCKEEFNPSNTNPKNCIFKCDYYQYKYLDNKYCTGEKECPEIVPYLITENSTCVEKCEKKAYYGVCLEECPQNTRDNNNICEDYNYICILSRLGEMREHLIDLKKDITPVTKKVKKYWKYFSQTNSHVDIYNHYLKEYTMIIYQYNSNCIKELLPDYISLDFSSCNPGNYLNSKFIIVLFLVPRENKYNQFYYKIYDVNNLDYPINTIGNCKSFKIEIPDYQANFDYDRYQKFKYKDGINLTNYLDNFFHDMCSQNYEDGKDIVIYQRRKEFFKDPNKICLDNCYWNEPVDNFKRAICVCSDTNHNLDNINNEYYDYNQNKIISNDFYDTNVYIFEHLKCFKYNFQEANIAFNMGSYMLIIFFIFKVVSMIIYGVYAIDSIKMYIIDFIKLNPPKKAKVKLTVETEEELKSDKDKEIDIQSIYSNKNTSFISIKETNSNKGNKKQFLSKDNFIKGENKKIKRWEKQDLLIGRSNNLGNSNNNNIKIQERYLKNITLEENNDKNQLKQNQEKITKHSRLFTSNIKLKNSIEGSDNTKKTFEKFDHTFTDFELNSMELYDAEIKDKRSFCYFYKLQMKSKQELFRAFCIHEPLYPLSVKIIIYAFNFSLNLCFNALLFTEEQIYEGIKSLRKNIGNIFLRAFYSFLIIKVIDYFVHLIIKNSNYLRSLVYRRKRQKQLRIDAFKTLKHINSNFIMLFILFIICDIFFWIFICSYCYCYNGEQLELFCAFLVTQFYIEIYCIPFGLYLTIFRFIGLKCKATTCYKMSQAFLDN